MNQEANNKMNFSVVFESLDEHKNDTNLSYVFETIEDSKSILDEVDWIKSFQSSENLNNPATYTKS